jgi:ADP-heptose:LPS heptosyltransferase
MKFLIVRLSSLGDIVHTLPIVHMIRSSYPNCQIDWLTKNQNRIFLSYIAELNTVYGLSAVDMLKLKNENYDYVIDVQGLFKSALLSKLVGGKKLIGFKNTREFADVFYDEKINAGELFKTDEHIVDLNLRLLSNIVECKESKVKFLIPKITEIKNKWLVENLNKIKQNEKQASIAVFPITRWESKRWPLYHWIELIEKLSVEFNIYICGGFDDIDKLKRLFLVLDSALVPYVNLTGRTDIADLIYLMQNVDIVLGMDSFGLHLASALRNDYESPRVVGVYGPTSPMRNGPYGSEKNCLYLQNLECISCRKKKCPLKHHKCMDEIVPDDVYKMICSLMPLKV